MEQEQIIIDVQFKGESASKSVVELTKNLEDLRKKQGQAKAALAEGGEGAEKAAREFATYTQAIAETKTELKAANAALAEANKTQQAQSGSIAAMRNELKQLIAQYDSLSEEQRNNADVGGSLRSRINELTDDLKGLESATGRNQRNVGNYSASILDAASKMGALGKGTQAVVSPMNNANNAMKAMAANPWMALISVAVSIVLKLTDAFKKNGAAMESLNKVFGIFSGIGVVVDKLIDRIAGGVAKFAEGLISLGQRLGLVNEEIQTGIDLAQEQLALAEASRRVRMEDAAVQGEIAELREKATDKESYSLQERIRFLQEAQEKEDAVAQQRIANAKREYDLAKQVADQANSSQEELDKVADAYVKWQQEIANTANASRTLNRQINTMNKEAENEAKQRAREAAAAAKQRRDDAIKKAQEQAKAELDIERQLLLEKINAIEDEQSKEVALALFNGQREIDELTIRLQAEKDLSAQAKDELAELIKLKQDALGAEVAAINQKYYDADVEANRIANEQKAAADKALADEQERIRQENEQKEKAAQERLSNARKSVYDNSKEFILSLGDVSAAFTKDEQKRAKIQKGVALAEIAFKEGELIANTAKAISSAVAGAAEASASTGPAAPFTILAFTTEMVAAVVGALAGTAASIAQAKTIISGQAFAEGGIVGGTSFSGDHVWSRTNSGEMVLNKQQQAQLFSIANGQQTAGVNYDAMAAMMREAFASAPAPILDYREFTNFQNNVAQFKETARL